MKINTINNMQYLPKTSVQKSLKKGANVQHPEFPKLVMVKEDYHPFRLLAEIFKEWLQEIKK